MAAIAKGLFFLFYYLFAIPVCALALLIWVIRVVVIVGVMVFAMLFEAWGNKGVPQRPLAIIESTTRIGPDVVKTLMTAPFRTGPTEDEPRQSHLFFELAFTVLFLFSLLLAITFRGYVSSLGSALEIPNNLFSDSGLEVKILAGYVFGSFGIVLYLLFTGKIQEGLFKTLVIPLYLVASGAVIVLVSYHAFSVVIAS